MTDARMPSDEGFAAWLDTATRKLSAETAARARQEIEEHFESAREDAVATGVTGDKASRYALSSLGDAKAVNRQYRMPWYSGALLGGLALLVISVSMVAAELVGTSLVAPYLMNDLGLSPTLMRITVLSITVFPVAWLAGFGLTRLAPVSGRKAVHVTLLLWLLTITTLQLAVYENHVFTASLLKVLFPCLAMWLGSRVARRGYRVA